ncbi:hypothetical protein HanRHA438_Chr16g0736121 [Helianthus annuus]|nr:hypothetical protein HanRHA438_Chr16g0736121 [Helianthus annuus]
MTSFNKKINWVCPKRHNVQDFETLRIKLINFKGKGQRLKFGTSIKDKTCNLLYYFLYRVQYNFSLYGLIKIVISI